MTGRRTGRTVTGRRTHLTAPVLVPVAIGTAAGALVRAGIEVWVGQAVISLTIVNTAGSLLLGFLVAWLAGPSALGQRAGRFRLLLGTGFCGGLTTYSTFAALLAARAASGDFLAPLLIALLIFACGLAAALVGLLAGRAFRRRASEADSS